MKRNSYGNLTSYKSVHNVLTLQYALRAIRITNAYCKVFTICVGNFIYP